MPPLFRALQNDLFISMANIPLRQYLSRLLNRENLTRVEATELLATMLQDDSTDAQIAAVLVALSAKGETAEELAGMDRKSVV